MKMSDAKIAKYVLIAVLVFLSCQVVYQYAKDESLKFSRTEISDTSCQKLVHKFIKKDPKNFSGDWDIHIVDIQECEDQIVVGVILYKNLEYLTAHRAYYLAFEQEAEDIYRFHTFRALRKTTTARVQETYLFTEDRRYVLVISGNPKFCGVTIEEQGSVNTIKKTENPSMVLFEMPANGGTYDYCFMSV